MHLLLGQTGVSGPFGDSEVERFCNDVAGEFLLPARELDLAALDQNRDFELLSDRVSALADKFKVSRTMVAYKAFRTHLESTRKLSSNLARRFVRSGLRAGWMPVREEPSRKGVPATTRCIAIGLVGE